MGANSHRELLLRCADAGAAAVVESSRPLEELVRLLETLVSTTNPTETEWRPPPVAVAVASVPLPSRLAPFAILTPREQSVLAELMEGRTADAIAKSGWVALSTVRSQIKSILQKLGVNSQLAAVAFARQAGWSHVGAAEAPSTRSFGRRAGDNPLAG